MGSEMCIRDRKKGARKGIHVLTADVEYDGELFGEPVIGYIVVE